MSWNEINEDGAMKAHAGRPIGSGGASGAANCSHVYREPTQQITFVYKNWKGVIRERRVIPLNIEFGHDHYHQPDQWLMHAIDMEKGARRTFALKDILTPIRSI